MPYTNVIFNPAFWKTLVQRPRFTNDNIPDLIGKVVIVTSTNSGLGYATTVALASHGAHVFPACRSETKALEAMERAKAEIKKGPKAIYTTNARDATTTEPALDFLKLDLDDMNDCHRAARTFLERGLPLHILFNNGGIMTSPFTLSADGIEQQFATFSKKSQPSRIVMLSSIGHEGSVKGEIDFDTLNDRTASNPVSYYGRSKLANILFGKALARRLASEKVYANMPHPGFVYTELQRNNKDSMGAVAVTTYDIAGIICAAKPEVGALNQLYLATSPEVEEKDLRGKYFVPVGNELRPSKL
ncbi:hypothetical protein BGX33_007840 [Mortierella sp. NVP41]|nr:hypothetical protein BGX33_007840 [Mortierella sp. NVP41]